MKTDKKLGLQVSAYLTEKGIETPFDVDPQARELTLDLPSNQKKKKAIEVAFTEIMLQLGLDMDDDSLRGTPERVARMLADEIFSGLDYDNFPRITTIENKMRYDEILVEKEVAVKSVCEHHFVVIDGVATVGYIPKHTVIGLSKINRVVNFFSRRPQIQERLTEQIHATLVFLLRTEDVAVLLDATHYCVKHRGIEDAGSYTVTSKLSGKFRHSDIVRSEFMSLARSKR